MEVLIMWLMLSGVVGAIASGKGRSGLAWFLLAVFLSPLIAGLLVLVVGSPYHCNACRKGVHKDASVCPYCGNDLRSGRDG